MNELPPVLDWQDWDLAISGAVPPLFDTATVPQMVEYIYHNILRPQCRIHSGYTYKIYLPFTFEGLWMASELEEIFKARQFVVSAVHKASRNKIRVAFSLPFMCGKRMTHLIHLQMIQRMTREMQDLRQQHSAQIAALRTELARCINFVDGTLGCAPVQGILYREAKSHFSQEVRNKSNVTKLIRLHEMATQI